MDFRRESIKENFMIKLEQYRDTWLSEKMNDVIGFYPREFYCLDNFSSFKVEWDGYLYASLEEAYQTAKFLKSAPEGFLQDKNLYRKPCPSITPQQEQLQPRQDQLKKQSWQSRTVYKAQYTSLQKLSRREASPTQLLQQSILKGNSPGRHFSSGTGASQTRQSPEKFRTDRLRNSRFCRPEKQVLQPE